MKLTRALLSLSLLVAVYPVVTAQNGQVAASSADQAGPFKPFRIISNIYYVGTSDVTSYLIVTPNGNILLDTGFEESGPIIRANIAALGFKLSDIKIMLSSHAHFDHVGGHADMQRDTGARVFASTGDAPVLESGGTKTFFQIGSFKPVKVDQVLNDGSPVSLGGTTLVAHVTSGHTPGNTAWTTTVTENGKEYRVVFVSSMSINPGVHLVNFAPWPDIADAYAKSFQLLKALPCDIFLGPHAGFFNLAEKASRMSKKGVNPFVDPDGYKNYLAHFERLYNEQLKQERK
ncbi:MAG TPA: subclass B3 metallo-beta-lactamase [Pyrinomonadaceae bacterium]|nr:subclass B3 metallo-beta-lactamase [Pyrinomonadaceae bacterium]